ncbi:predicted protein [Streptomyces viridochromogenes DSM 40736]|uniref:Predicted protein n=1 Tax=Streptomyces viridochromogenes (strain DSM 40736 / JCM 4977 / BCRC 1201 / Tue 494) TaxID=591159 RepID=D9XBM2_STRVT|nr:predicted protein [Streptomyces viridochromogenes DSM 40736]
MSGPPSETKEDKVGTPTPANPGTPGTQARSTAAQAGSRTQTESQMLQQIIAHSEVLGRRLAGPKSPERTPKPFWK